MSGPQLFTCDKSQLAIKFDFLQTEEIFPFGTDQEELRRDEFHQFVQLLFWNAASVVRNDTSARSSDPNLCGVG